MLDNRIYKTQLGFYSTEKMDFVDEPENEEDYIELILTRLEDGSVILADKQCLRETLLIYGFILPKVLQTVTERQTAIQEEYEKKLEQALKSITSAKALKKEDAVISELETRYANLLTEMTTKINDEVTNDA